ncbi:MAG: PQQ-binding-like beta-propeller repeat protein, partial [Acidobacteria bacterium]|nr:PQQ-binding-like beta-propeller repeat protein [Acidobacteriota bacterium]
MRFLTLVLASLVFLATLSGGEPQARSKQSSADRWNQFRGNHQLTGVASSVPAKELKLVWTYEAGDSIESSAVIVDGAVFFGSYSGELIALELSSGKVLWKYRAKDAIGESSPAVQEGRVFACDLSGVVHAVDARSGKGIWTFATKSEIKSSPVVVGDRVLIGSYDEHLYCLSVRDGSFLWKFRTEGPVHCTVGVSDGVAYISGCDEVFRAIRISDGKEIFNVASGGYTGASPALGGKSAYFGTFNNEVVAVDLASRRIAWRYQHPQRQFPFYSSAAVIDDRVVVGGRDKMVHCLNAKTGKSLWTFLTKGRVESSPAIAAGRVYIGSNDGRLYILDLTSGEKLWEFNAGSAL